VDKLAILSSKISNEFDVYKAEMLTKSAQEIFDAHYKIGCYEEFVCLFEKNNDWSESELDVLINEPDLLISLYREWLDCDTAIQEEYKSCVQDFVESIISQNEEIEDEEDLEI